MRVARAALALALLSAFASAEESFLIVIADDIGVDRIGAYAEHPDPGRTPNIDGLAARGVRFENAWAYPVCSPTRAALLTGRHAFRTGIGTVVSTGPLPGLATDEPTVPRMLGRDWLSVALGKWHLAGRGQDGHHPRQLGFNFHAGSLYNFSFGVTDYYHWVKHVNGTSHTVDTYATTETVDDALRFVSSAPGPWCLWVALNAPHTPEHAPPAHLHGFSLEGAPQDSVPEHTKAMIEALDTELGRLLAAVDLETTTVVFISDNGTNGPAVTAPFDPDRAKGSLYEGGINVPLIVAGPAVDQPGSVSAALVSVTDVYATVAELAGRPSTAEDSVSFAPYLSDPSLPSIRDTVFAERFGPNGHGPYTTHRRAIRDVRYKLIVDVITGEQELYDLEVDPFERLDLLEGSLSVEQQYRRERLLRRMTELVAS